MPSSIRRSTISCPRCAVASSIRAVRLSGTDPEAFDLITHAFGLLPIDGSPPGELGITADEARAMSEFEMLGAMFSTEEALSFVRLVGSALSRIAEAAVALFLTDVEAEILASGGTELALARKIYDALV